MSRGETPSSRGGGQSSRREQAIVGGVRQQPVEVVVTERGLLDEHGGLGEPADGLERRGQRRKPTETELEVRGELGRGQELGLRREIDGIGQRRGIEQDRAPRHSAGAVEVEQRPQNPRGQVEGRAELAVDDPLHQRRAQVGDQLDEREAGAVLEVFERVARRRHGLERCPGRRIEPGLVGGGHGGG